jgi:hypothetical protein
MESDSHSDRHKDRHKDDRGGSPESPEGGPRDHGYDSLAPSSEQERASAIASVLRDQEQKAQVRGRIRPPGDKPLLPQLLYLVLATAVSVYVWFGSPSWLEPDAVPPPPVSVEEASVRLAIFLQAQRIEAYREENGRLPAFLEEAGPRAPGVSYRRMDSRTYLIRGQGERVGLTYTSDQAPDLFLGRGEDILARALGDR